MTTKTFNTRSKCSLCKETGHNIRTCPFGYREHFEPVECHLLDKNFHNTCPFGYTDYFEQVDCSFNSPTNPQLTGTQQISQISPCCNFEIVRRLNEPLFAELLHPQSVDTFNLILLSDVAYSVAYLPIKKKVNFSNESPKILEFSTPMSENASLPKIPKVPLEDKDDVEDTKLKMISVLNREKNTLCPNVNNHELRRNTKIMKKSVVSEKKKQNYFMRVNPVKFVMGELLSSSRPKEDLIHYPKDILEKVILLIQNVILELNAGREVYPLYESSTNIKKVNIRFLEIRKGMIELYI